MKPLVQSSTADPSGPRRRRRVGLRRHRPLDDRLGPGRRRAAGRRNRPYEEFLDIGLNQYGFQVLPILTEHTARLLTLPFLPEHKDPFDRLIVAQALVEQIPIVSADSPFDAYGVTRL